jgi:hypothetical protein
VVANLSDRAGSDSCPPVRERRRLLRPVPGAARRGLCGQLTQQSRPGASWSTLALSTTIPGNPIVNHLHKPASGMMKRCSGAPVALLEGVRPVRSRSAPVAGEFSAARSLRRCPTEAFRQMNTTQARSLVCRWHMCCFSCGTPYYRAAILHTARSAGRRPAAPRHLGARVRPASASRPPAPSPAAEGCLAPALHHQLTPCLSSVFASFCRSFLRPRTTFPCN